MATINYSDNIKRGMTLVSVMTTRQSRLGPITSLPQEDMGDIITINLVSEAMRGMGEALLMFTTSQLAADNSIQN